MFRSTSSVDAVICSNLEIIKDHQKAATATMATSATATTTTSTTTPTTTPPTTTATTTTTTTSIVDSFVNYCKIKTGGVDAGVFDLEMRVVTAG